MNKTNKAVKINRGKIKDRQKNSDKKKKKIDQSHGKDNQITRKRPKREIPHPPPPSTPSPLPSS